jgi:hypothetical protein
MSKNELETERATNDVTIWRIRVACRISKAICTYAHAHAHPPGYPHSCTHAQTCTHRAMCNTYCFSTATMVFRERSTLLRCTYIACLVVSRNFHSYLCSQCNFYSVCLNVILSFMHKSTKCTFMQLLYVFYS